MARFATESVTVDAMVIESVPGSNYGTLANLNIGTYSNGVEYRAFYALPSTSLAAGESVVGAVLTLTKGSSGVDNDAGGSVDVYRVLAPWSETGITWGNQPATEYVKTVQVAPATTNQPFDVDISDADAGHGVMLTSAEFYAVHSAEASTSYRPQVTYEIAAEVIPPQDVSPAGVGSAESFGVPAVSSVVPEVLEPAGIASAEAFGAAAVVVVQPVELTPEAIVSGEAFGQPQVIHGADVETVPYPTGEAVAEFMDAPGDARLIALAEVHVGVVTHFARVYTRGNGFYVEGVAPEIAAVILAATARLASNPGQIDIHVGSVRRAQSFKGWTLAEQKVLNPYRGVAR